MTMKASTAEFTRRHVVSRHVYTYKDVVTCDKIFALHFFKRKNADVIAFRNTSAFQSNIAPSYLSYVSSEISDAYLPDYMMLFPRT